MRRKKGYIKISMEQYFKRTLRFFGVFGRHSAACQHAVDTANPNADYGACRTEKRSDSQQQMLTFPGADDLVKGFVFRQFYRDIGFYKTLTQDRLQRFAT